MAPKTTAKPKVLSSTEMTRRAQTFVAKYKGEVSERAASQTWWNDFFTIFGVDRYSTATFERRARRASTGNLGAIDVFMPGVMIAEQKSFGRNLAAADGQAEDYLLGGDITPAEMPRYIVSSDFNTVQITDLESPLDPPFEFNIQKLPRHISRFAFLSGYAAPKRRADKQAEVSVKAARAMGALYDALLGDVDAADEGHDSEHAAIFMTRLLFLMFGDDADGLWDQGQFQRFIEERTSEDGSDTGAQIAYLFQILDTPAKRRSDRLDAIEAAFPYVNGGLFRERIDIPTFDSTMRDALLRACNEDWSNVSPAIFGSLFQGMSSREQRRANGEHYTTESNILKALRPLFLDDLEHQLQAAYNSDAALVKLHDSLAEMRFLDPAAGSGNFIIVAYREMRDLELRLLVRLRELRGQSNDYALDATWDLKVTPDQFGGIEINWWPAKIAETAMFLVDHQANQRMAESLGAAPQRLPITIAAKIVHGNALEEDWRAHFPPAGRLTYVFGNPPFLGKAQRDAAQTLAMKAAWGDDYDGELDFVTTWFILAARFLAGARGAFALVSTNSIAQGVVAPSLFEPLRDLGWRISFAHRTFAWTTEATGKAGVHCVIIGFNREATPPRLFEYVTPHSEAEELPGTANINGYLVAAPDAFVHDRSSPLAPALTSNIRFGSMAADGGNLFLSDEEAATLRADPVTAPYVRQFVGAKELIRGNVRWCIWMPEPDAAAISHSPILKSHVEGARAFRAAAKDAGVRADAAAPYRFHRNKQPDSNFLCIPAHFSETRAYATAAYLGPDVVPGNANFTTTDPDGFLFAVISSAMFLTWQRLVGGRIKSDLRFGSTSVWNTYPFPEVTPAERARLIDAGQKVVLARAAHPDASLASLYSPLAMPADLIAAHAALDRITDRLFGFAKTPTLAQRQQRLFERYATMTTTPVSA